jgi:hypothetical protein
MLAEDMVDDVEYGLSEILLANAYRRDTVSIMEKCPAAMDTLEEERTRACGPREDPTTWTEQVNAVERVLAESAEDITQHEERMAELKGVQKKMDRGLPPLKRAGYVTCELTCDDDWACVMLREGNTDDLCLAATSLCGCATHTESHNSSRSNLTNGKGESSR